MIRIFYLLSAIVIGLLLWTLVVAGQVLSVGNQMVLDYSATERRLTLSSSMDVADVRVGFADLPGQYMTVRELREWVRARPTLKPQGAR